MMSSFRIPHEMSEAQADDLARSLYASLWASHSHLELPVELTSQR